MTAHPKRPRDPNQLAKLIVDTARGRSLTVIPRQKSRARTLFFKLSHHPGAGAG